MTDLIIYILLGLTVGYIGGYAGIGGGPFLVSFLVLVMGFSQLSAQGNVLTMMLGPMSLLGVASLYPYVKKQWISITIGVLSYCICSYFGAVAAFYVGENDVRTYFAILLLIIAGIQVYPFFRKKTTNSLNEKESVSQLWILLLGSFTGAIGGMFGIGAGVLMVPILIGLFNMKKEFARALSLAILVPPVSYGAYIKYNLENPVDWKLVAILFFSYFVANYFGAKAGTKASNSTFKIIYAVILVAIALIYLL